MTNFRINRVYTRSGDHGDTGLVGGARVSKACLQVECYGELDELNSLLGLLQTELGAAHGSLPEVIAYLQQELFDIGSELATAPGMEYPGMWKTEAKHVAILEGLCDSFGDGLPELTSFLIPGGSKSAGFLHLARTVARRAERALVHYRNELKSEGKPFNSHLLEYLNRLSDLLFILARRVLVMEGKNVPLWQPERERRLPQTKLP